MNKQIPPKEELDFEDWISKNNINNISNLEEIFLNSFPNLDEERNTVIINGGYFQILEHYKNIIDNKISQKFPFHFIIKRPIPNLLSEKDIFTTMEEKININKKIKEILYSVQNITNILIDNVKKEIEQTNNARYKKNSRENKNESKLGRKKKNDYSFRYHSKYAPDNIINKIKNVLKKYLIIFVNNVINSLYKKQQKISLLNKLNLPVHNTSSLIKDIDYKSMAKKKKKSDNLELINFKIKEFLSQNISSRYKNLNKVEKDLSNYNTLVIKGLLDDNKNKENNNLFNFIFSELKIEDWLNIFIHQKELNDFAAFNSLENSQKNIVEKSLVRIEEYFDELLDEGDIYFYCFILLIYNFKRYFVIKQERRCKKLNDN